MDYRLDCADMHSVSGGVFLLVRKIENNEESAQIPLIWMHIKIKLLYISKKKSEIAGCEKNLLQRITSKERFNPRDCVVLVMPILLGTLSYEVPRFIVMIYLIKL